jgi:hypothetical protein
MSSELIDHCQELVRVLQDDVGRMCATMLSELVVYTLYDLRV